MIGIIDYGSGNVSFKNIYERAGVDAEIISNPKNLDSCTHLILPGVGAFDWTMKKLLASGLMEEIDFQATVKKKPILGICVGMQVMAESSEEGIAKGFGWFNTKVKKFSIIENLPIPQMGWNTVHPERDSSLFPNSKLDEEFYFLHSYYFDLTLESEIICKSNYFIDFACAIQKENIYGVQFHPEKSHKNGINLLINFL